MAVYVDTSAMAKRYLNEVASDAFDTFLSERDDDFVVSPLTLTEMESVLQRRLRGGQIDKRFLQRTRSLLLRDMSSAVWQVRSFEPGAFDAATGLIRDLSVPLTTLDALHLASALAYGCGELATADRQLAAAAAACRLDVHTFS